MRAILACPEPIDLGSSTAESLHSLIRRTARTYVMPAHAIALTVARAGGVSACKPQNFKKPSEWVGTGQLAQQLAHGMELLSGVEASRLTMLRPNTALGVSREFVSRCFRLCPMCIRPHSDVEHGMLAHQMAWVLLCPEHSCQLLERCRQCECRISPWVDYFTDPSCRRCQADLSRDVIAGREYSAFEKWRVEQMHELIAFCTRADDLAIPKEWTRTFGAGVMHLRQDGREYSKQERMALKVAWRAVGEKPFGRPSLTSLLRVASIQAVSVVDLIQRPEESLAPRMLTAESISTPTAPKVMGLRGSWIGLSNAMERFIEKKDSIYLPPLRWLTNAFNLSAAGVWSHYPELALAYKNAQLQMVRRKSENLKSRALSTALDIVSSNESRGVRSFVRRDGLEVSLRVGVSKEVAEQSIRLVIASFRELGHSQVLDWFNDSDDAEGDDKLRQRS